jgi:hypothetical protein
MIQFVLLTPKNDSYPRPPEPQPYVGAILGTNILCILLHLWFAAPSASEAMRGYLHGGLAMDFIGQQGPSSKIMLIFLDLLVVTLQSVHLSAHIARSRLRTAIPTGSEMGIRMQPAPTPALSAQNIDSEERGIRRSVELEEQGDIELQSLNTSGHVSAPTDTAPPDALAVQNTSDRENLPVSTAPQTDTLIFDAFYSGQINIGDFDVWRTIREQFWAYQKAPPEVNGTYRAQLAGRLMGLRLATGALGRLN